MLWDTSLLEISWRTYEGLLSQPGEAQLSEGHPQPWLHSPPREQGMTESPGIIATNHACPDSSGPAQDAGGGDAVPGGEPGGRLPDGLAGGVTGSKQMRVPPVLKGAKQSWQQDGQQVHCSFSMVRALIHASQDKFNEQSSQHRRRAAGDS